MRKRTTYLTTFAIVVTLFLCSQIAHTEIHSESFEKNTPKESPQKHKYKLTWQEDFNGNSIDTLCWSKIKRIRPDVAWNKYMSDHSSLYEVKEGRLRLFARKNKGIAPNDTAKYLTGGISTRHKKTFKYGKIEVRACIKGAKGCWPAIWIKDNDYNSPNYKELAEIDVMEYYNTDDKVTCTIHNSYTLIKKQTKNPPCQMQAPIRKNKYNTYTIEICPDHLIWRVNGKKFFTYPRIPEKGFQQYPFGSECYLMIDMQVGNKWLTEIDDKSLPAYIDIDWVKFYDLVE